MMKKGSKALLLDLRFTPPQEARASQKNCIFELDAVLVALRSRDHDYDDENAPDFNELWGRLARRALL